MFRRSLPVLVALSVVSFSAFGGVYFESILKTYEEDSEDAAQITPLVLGKFWISKDRVRVEVATPEKVLWKARYAQHPAIFVLESNSGQKVDVSAAEVSSRKLSSRALNILKNTDGKIAYPENFKSFSGIRFDRIEEGLSFDRWKDSEKYKGFQGSEDSTVMNVWSVSFHELGLQQDEFTSLQKVVSLLMSESRELSALLRLNGNDWVASLQYPGVPVKVHFFDPEDEDEPIVEVKLQNVKWRSFEPRLFIGDNRSK